MKLADLSDEAFAAYVAGFTDGEGHLEVHPSRAGVRIVIANTNRDVLEQIRNRLGEGRISQRHSVYDKPHYLPRFVLVFDDGLSCGRVLDRIRPYLQIKADPADVILARIAEWHALIRQGAERNRLIREAIERGEKQTNIAQRFHTSKQTVSRIKLGQYWPSERPKDLRGLNTLRGKANYRHLSPPEPLA